MHSINPKKLIFGAAIGPITIVLSGCALASLPANYSPIEKQTVAELSPSNYTPRSDEEREAIATQDMFAQTAFWSKEYDLNPADLEAAVNLSANLRKMGNPGKSIEVAQHTRALYPRDVDLMTELGASLIADNQPNEAIKIIDSALFQRPRSGRLWSLKGAALDQLERFNEARQMYTKALGFTPNDPSIHANVGLSYALEGDPKTAEIWLRRASGMPGASANVRQNLALVLGLQGKLDEAEKWAEQDLDKEGASSNLAYIRSLRGTSSPSTPAPVQKVGTSPSPRTYGNAVPKPQARYTPPTSNTVRPQTAAPAKFGAKLTVAGDPASMQNGPQTVSEAALQALRQRNTALRDMPSQPRLQPQTPAQGQRVPQPTQRVVKPVPSQTQGTPTSSAQNVLGRISQKNVPKATIAQHQRQILAQRAAYAAQQRQQMQMYPYAPQQGMPGPQYQYPAQIPPGYGAPGSVPQQAANPQPYQPDNRQPARVRRR